MSSNSDSYTNKYLKTVKEKRIGFAELLSLKDNQNSNLNDKINFICFRWKNFDFKIFEMKAVFCKFF